MTHQSHQTESTSREFLVHMPGLLELLSRNLYSGGADVVVRELLQNAVDAISARLTTPGQEFAPEILIECHPADCGWVLTVTDNGIGMTESEIEKCLSTVSYSSKRESPRETDFIGRFGVGLLSGFICSETITVITRHALADKGFRWQGDKTSGHWTVSAVGAEIGVGSSASLVIHSPQESGLTPERVLELARRYGGYLPYPIKFRQGPIDTMVSSPPFWRADKSEEQLISLGSEFFGGAKFSGAFMIKCESTATEGVAFIESSATRAGSMPSHRLYVKGMLVGEYIRGFTPPGLPFLRCALNSDSLPLNASREDIMWDDARMTAIQQAVRLGLEGWIKAKLAEDGAPSLIDFVHKHQMVLTEEFQASGAFADLLTGWLPLRTSTGTKDLISALQAHGEVFWMHEKDFKMVESKACRQDCCVVCADTHPAYRLMEGLAKWRPEIPVSHLTASGFLSRFVAETDPHDPARSRLKALVEKELAEDKCACAFDDGDDPYVPATLEVMGREAWSVARATGLGDGGGCHGARARLILHSTNSLITKLLETPDLPDDIAQAWIREIYHGAKLHAGEQPTHRDRVRQLRAQEVLWNATVTLDPGLPNV